MSERQSQEVEHYACANCGLYPESGRIPPVYVLSLRPEDRDGDTVESYPFDESLSFPFACSDECWREYLGEDAEVSA